MQRLNTIGLGMAGIAVLLMTLVGALDIVTYFVFSWPVPASYEVTELLMAVVVFMAISTLQAKGMNISMDLLYQRMRPRAQRAVVILSAVLALFFFGLIAWQGWLLAVDSVAVREYTQGAYPVPVYPSKLLFALGASLIVAQVLKDIYLLVTKRRSDSAPAKGPLPAGFE